MKTNTYPHRERRSAINFIIGLLIAAIIVMACSCTVARHKGKDPCKYRRGMSGYGYGWLKCRETKKVCILDKDGAIICTYIDNK